MTDHDLERDVAAAKKRWGDLAAQVMVIAGSDLSDADALEKVTIILDSVYLVGLSTGKREGIERGVKASADTYNSILDLMRPRNARS